MRHLAIWFILILSLLVGGYVRPAAAQGGVPVACDEIDIIFVLDQSGSMFGIPGLAASDPQRYREFGTQTAIDVLGTLRYQTYPASTIKVAAVDFGDTIALRLPWTDLVPTNEAEHRQQQADITAARGVRTGDLSNTNFIAAMQGAASLFSQVDVPVNGCPKRAVILLTDGMPAGPSVVNASQHFAELQRYVSQFMPPSEHQIFVIGLDATNQYWDQVRGPWEQITGDPSKVRRVSNAQELGSQMLAIAQRLTNGLQVTGSAVAPTCVQGNQLMVPPFTRQIQLIVIKNDPNADVVHVFDGSGQEALPGRADLNVTVTGKTEPIETLTINAPPPGAWRVETTLPPIALQNCQIQLLAFRAAGELRQPRPGTLVQFQRAPLDLHIVDAAGGSLPAYADPAYTPQLTAWSVDATGITETLTLVATPDTYQYTGEILPLTPGTLTLGAQATSHNPDGTAFQIFDRTLASYDVQTVTLGLTSPITTTIPQHGQVALAFGLLAGTQPVTVDLPVKLHATLTGPDDQPQTLPITETAGTYATAFRPKQSGMTTLELAGTVETPGGSVSIPGQTVRFNVYPASLVKLEVIEPSGGSYVATDTFFRPTGMPMEVAITDEQGRAFGLGELGVSDPARLLKVVVNDSQGHPITDALQLTQTGSPNRFRLASNSLGIGDFSVTFTPQVALGRSYAWSEPSYSVRLQGQINFLAFGLLAACAAVLGLLIWSANAFRLAARHPLTGYVEIYQNKPSTLDDLDLIKSSVLRRTLPTRRNRTVITPSTGLLGWIEWVFHLDLARNKSHPMRRMVITCATDADAKAGRAEAEIFFRDKTTRKATIGPKESPYSLGMTYFLEKGPREAGLNFDLIDLPEISIPNEERR